MIEITEDYVYQPEACDCCHGWYDLHYHLTIDGEYHGEFTDALEMMRYINIHGSGFKYNEATNPDD